MTGPSRRPSEDGAAPYAGRRIALATRHGKEAALGPPLQEGLGVELVVPPDLDTDALGTFSGEVPRPGTMLEVAVAKARLAMTATGLPLGLASEGSYGPHPEIAFLGAGLELLTLVDDELGLTISEQWLDDRPCFDQMSAADAGELDDFLERIGFPEHAVIVGPNQPPVRGPFVKGIRDGAALAEAVRELSKASEDGLALIQSDMRAHMNPTRMAALGRLAAKLVERLQRRCPACGAPGFGVVGVEAGLPCADCGGPSNLVSHRLLACARPGCDHREARPREDGLTQADPWHCPRCNP